MRTVVEGVLQAQTVGRFVHLLQKKHDLGVVASLGVLNNVLGLLYLGSSEVVLLSFFGKLFIFFLLKRFFCVTVVLVLVFRRVSSLASA